MSYLSEPVRLMIHEEADRFTNMAVDEALLRLLPDHPQPILRFYQWSEPAVSIGYFQPTTEAPEGRSLVRRYTGGGLVDHEADFTYSVIVPRGHDVYEAGTVGSYEQIHTAVAEALRKQGLVADLAPCCQDVESVACFQKAVKYDVVGSSEEEKLAGAAQRRTREGCLHQGSILIQGYDYEVMCETLAETLLPLLGSHYEDSELLGTEESRVQELLQSRYSTDEWNLAR